ncbi:MAG: hypothetical protein AAF160_19305 [Pseudomonadota bacterium]
MADEHLSLAAPGFVAIAARRVVPNVVALLKPGLHLLDGLAPVLLPLQFSLGGHDGLDECPFGRVLEGEVKAFDPRAAGLELLPQLDVEDGVTREALQIVEDHDVILGRLRIEEAEQRHHARPLHEVPATGGIIWEHSFDVIAA